MNTTVKNQLRQIMRQAWMLVKKYGFAMAEAMKQAWAISKLRKAMSRGIVKFIYTKLDGSTRTAWGTLKEELMPTTQGSGRKANETLVTYYDSEKESFRCFKVANFVKMV